MFMGDTVVSIGNGGSHGSDSHGHTSSERNGQPHWFNLTNLEGGRIQASHHKGSTMLLSTKDKR